MSFDANFDCGPFFCSKNCKTFFRLQKQWKWIGLRDAHWISWRSSRKHLKFRSVVGWLSGQGTLGCRIFSSIVFALRHILVLLSSRGTMTQVSFRHYRSAHLDWPCDHGVAPKFFQSSSLRLFVEKTGIFGEGFRFRTRCSLLSTQFSTFGTSLLWKRIW